jgi:Tol biopolymer transport system component
VRCVAVLAVLVLVLLGGSCGGSSDALEGTVGTIIVERSNGSVHAIELPRGDERRLGSSSRFGGEWSMDGTKIVASHDDTFVVRSATGRARARFDVPFCYSPTWSPDGRRLACYYTEPHWIKVMNEDGSLMDRITPDCCYLPSWSPDGSRIAYVSFGRYADGRVSGPAGVFVMNADGSQKRHLSGPDYDEYPPQWSPDGETLAFTANDDVWLVGVDGSNRRRLLDSPDRSTADVSWSPDGRKLAVTHGDGDFEIFVVDVASGEARNLTANERIDDEGAWWSPDGKFIAFSRETDGASDLYLVPSEGGDAVRLTESDAAEWILHWAPASSVPRRM